MRSVGRSTVRGSSSAHLEVVRNPVRFSELVRRVRIKNGWNQGELAAHLEIRRPQTVSAWERGTKPQRRHYAKLAVFLGLPDERAVEALLSDDVSEADDAPTSQPPVPAATAELQRRAVEAVVLQLEVLKWRPSDELAGLLRDLLEWAKQPGIDVPDEPDATADPVRAEEDD